MRGEIQVLYPNYPIGVLNVTRPPPSDFLKGMINGDLLEVVPHFDHYLDFSGQPTPCIVLCNQEALAQHLKFNIHATALWHFIARTKGHKITQQLFGTVLICFGDEEFREVLMD